MMKKTKICFLILLFVCIINVTVNAANTDIFSTTNAQGAKDEEVTIYLKLNQKMEFASADITMEYDTSKLEYVKYTEMGIINDAAMHIVKNNSDTGKIAIGYVSKTDTATSAKEPGDIVGITFKIKTDEVGTTNVDIKCTSLKKDSGEDIEVSDIQSEIEIVTERNSDNVNNDSANEEDVDNNTTQNNEKKPKTLPITGESLINITTLALILALISFYVYKKYNYLKKHKKDI